MRKLFILRGAMGCGKSTFIKNNNLENYTLSTDKIRLMYNSVEMNINYKEEIPQYNNQKVWNTLFMILKERMQKGELTIIDAVHATYDESLKTYKKLAEKYRYRLYIVDFTNIDINEVLIRNQNREGYKIVPESSIRKSYKIFAKEKIPNSFKIISPDEFWQVLNNSPIDMNIFEKVHIIGDIHGCFSALKKYFDKYPINEKDAYIFLGDYFDKGLENYNTFMFLNKIIDNKNMFFLMGNHEDKLYKYACDDNFKMYYYLNNTIKEFEDKNVSKTDLRGFIKKLSQISYFTFGLKTYLVNHGGIPYFPNKSLDFYSSNTFIYGVDNYETNIDKIYNEYMKKEKNEIYQIHGHRNFEKISYNKYKYSINLDGLVENGGYLRVLTLNKNGKYNYVAIKNTVYDKKLKEKDNVFNLVNNLLDNNYIYTKDLGNNLYSFNFTKEAFYKKVWDNITTQARGLFIDISKYEIVARSYNKFFNINERLETKLDNIEKKLAYPVNFYLKYNGFLGLLAVRDNELFFASKSTNSKEFVNYFKNIFYSSFNEKQIKTIKDKLKKDDITMVFEVIDSINDKHIIKYNNSKIVLLDMIYNKVNYEKIAYNELVNFAKNNNMEYKQLIYIANNLDEFKIIYSQTTDENYKLNNEYIEGFVIEDDNNFMFKVKTNYYEKWKYLRGLMEKAISTNDYNVKLKEELEIKFIKYLESKYKDKNIDISNINIIDERDNFYNNN